MLWYDHITTFVLIFAFMLLPAFLSLFAPKVKKCHLERDAWKCIYEDLRNARNVYEGLKYLFHSLNYTKSIFVQRVRRVTTPYRTNFFAEIFSVKGEDTPPRSVTYFWEPKLDAFWAKTQLFDSFWRKKLGGNVTKGEKVYPPQNL